MSGRGFVVTVAAEMEPVLLSRFDDVEVSVNGGVTQLRLLETDPSFLHGILHRLEVLGVELIDVRPLGDAPV